MSPPRVEQPPPPPNPAIAANAATSTGARIWGQNNRGFGSTMINGGQGLQSPARIGGKTLLGQ